MRLAAAPFAVLALVLVCVDLFRIGVGQNPAIDRNIANVPERGAVRFLNRQSPARFVSARRVSHNVLAFQFGLYEARGYDVPICVDTIASGVGDSPGASSVAAEFLDIPLTLGALTPRALRTLGSWA